MTNDNATSWTNLCCSIAVGRRGCLFWNCWLIPSSDFSLFMLVSSGRYGDGPRESISKPRLSTGSAVII